MLFLRLFLVLNLVTLAAPAQPPGLTIELISTEQGLPHKQVNCITQDNKGFMWVGTANGLYRYDGYHFFDFTPEFSGRRQLKGVNISSLVKDASGNIWIGYSDGLAVLNPFTGGVEVKILNGYRGTEKSVVRVYFDRMGRLLVYLADNTLLCYNQQMQLQFSYHFSVSLKEDGLEMPLILEDDDGSFWLPTAFNGIDHLSAAGKFIAHYRQVIRPEKQHTLKKLKDRNGLQFSFYLGQRFNDVIQHPPIPFQRKLDSVFRSYISPSGLTDMSGNQWDFRMETLVLTDTIARKVLKCTLPYKGDFFYDYPVLNVFQGMDRTIWACSKKGLFKIHYRRSPFKNYLSDNRQPPEQGISIRGMVEDRDGNVWVGSYPFTPVIGSAVANLSLIRKGSDTAEPVYLHDPAGKVFNASASPIYNILDDGATLLASSESRYIYRIHKKNRVVESYPCPDESMVPIKGLLRMDPHTILFTSGKSAGVYQPVATGSAAFRRLFDHRSGDAPGGLNHFFEAGNQHCWAVGNEGLYLLNKEGRVIRNFSADPNLPVLDINFLYQGEGNVLWLGTRHGLVKMDTALRTSRVLTTADGLPNNNVMSILPDEMGYLWLSTDYGISRYHPKLDMFINYDLSDELPHYEFNRMAYLKASDGRLYFGGLNGVTAVYPREVDTSLGNLQPQLVGYSKYDGRLDSVLSFQAVSVTSDAITFNHNDKLFTFRFMLPAYRSAVKNRFSYKLEGWDQDWQTNQQSATISFSYLPAGTYQLRVRGAATGDPWERREYTIRIIVLKAWYKTAWFYTLMAGIMAALVYALYRYRLHQVLKVLRIRDKISADLHDELGSVLTQISLQSEMVNSNIYSETQKMAELQNISNTSRQAIHAMSDIVWSVKPENDRVYSLIDRMKDHADLMLVPLGMKVSFTVSGMDEQKQMDNLLRQEIFLIFKEAVHNIVKHSDATAVDIELKQSDGKLLMTVSNDIGQPKPALVPGGNGLKNMEKRAAGIRAELKIIREDHRFTVWLQREAIG